ncbi:MAG: folylpolyglutamate synthase/dihydrofolate synthase family protein [Kofleriaceae bacterium]
MTPYAELLARLVRARRFGVILGLDRMRALLDRLGAPDRQLGKIIHVAGTNGKGSTVAIIASIARAAGLRVATYTSPHLSCLRERITVDGEMISEREIVDVAAAVDRAGGHELTFFEQVTAIAMVAIARAGVDLTVLEVGLGGRLDATNTVTADVAVITGVAMDHEAILGPALEAIAREKAGIIKPGQRVVIGASGEPAAVQVLVAEARAAGVEPVVIDDTAIATVPALALEGSHQRRNAAAALAALDALPGIEVAGTARVKGLAQVRHPGRFEQIGDVIVDGAHNPHGAAALAETVCARGIRPVLIIAVSADKSAGGIAEALAPVMAAIVATRYQQERAMAPALLADAFRAVAQVPVEVAPDLSQALAVARRFGRPIVVAGSLFLVGEARVALLGAPADPVAVSDPVAARST